MQNHSKRETRPDLGGAPPESGKTANIYTQPIATAEGPAFVHSSGRQTPPNTLERGNKTRLASHDEDEAFDLAALHFRLLKGDTSAREELADRLLGWLLGRLLR